MNSFSRCNRLKKNSQFKEIFSNGKKIYTPSIVLHYSYNKTLSTPKLGIATSKRYGNAVKRNAFKRLSRESFRLYKAKLPASLQMVLRPQKNISSVTFDEFTNAFLLLLKALVN